MPNLTIEKVYNLSMAVGVRLYSIQVIKWIKELKTIKSLDSHINLPPPSKQIRTLFEKSLMLSYLIGHDEAKTEIEGQEKGNKKELKAPSNTSGFDEAIRLLKNKPVIPGPDFKAAAAEIKATAFSIQRVERMDVIKVVKGSLITAIDQGWDLKFWKSQIDEVFLKAGLTPLAPWHLETIFKTNIMSVYNIGHRESYDKNKAVDWLELLVVLDNRTSEICIPLAGSVYPKNDPIWDTITPPNHYKCRDRISGLTKGYIKRKGIKQSPESKKKASKGVHEHFTHSPKTLKGYNKKMDNIVKEKASDLKKIN